jgi:hypothetical protein
MDNKNNLQSIIEGDKKNLKFELTSLAAHKLATPEPFACDFLFTPIFCMKRSSFVFASELEFLLAFNLAHNCAASFGTFVIGTNLAPLVMNL